MKRRQNKNQSKKKEAVNRTLNPACRRRRQGFTLMEVLLVLAILVILTSLVTVSFMTIKKSSSISATKTQIGAFEQQLSIYQLHMNSYPTSQQGLNALRQPPSDLKNVEKWQGPYANKDIPIDPWDNPYQYESNVSDQYKIWSSGPDGQSGTDDDIIVTSG